MINAERVILNCGGYNMSEDKRAQTHTTGQVYTHPRSKDYGSEFDRIFKKDECCGEECEECKCQTGKSSSDA